MCSRYDDPSQIDSRPNFTEIVERALSSLLEVLGDRKFEKIIIKQTPHQATWDHQWFAYAIMTDGKPYEYAIYFDEDGHMDTDGY